MEQEIDDKTVNDAIEVAEKAVNNLDKKVEEIKIFILLLIIYTNVLVVG